MRSGSQPSSWRPKTRAGPGPHRGRWGRHGPLGPGRFILRRRIDNRRPARFGVTAQPHQLRPHLRSVLKAQHPVFFKGTIEQVFQARRQFRVETKGGCGGAFQDGVKTMPEVSPRNGKTPVAISYNTTPNENKSVRTSSSLPRSCSGDI